MIQESNRPSNVSEGQFCDTWAMLSFREVEYLIGVKSVTLKVKSIAPAASAPDFPV